MLNYRHHPVQQRNVPGPIFLFRTIGNSSSINALLFHSLNMVLRFSSFVRMPPRLFVAFRKRVMRLTSWAEVCATC